MIFYIFFFILHLKLLIFRLCIRLFFSNFFGCSIERNSVRGNTEIQRLFNMSMSAIKQEIEANHAPIKGDVTVLDALLNKIPTFR